MKFFLLTLFRQVSFAFVSTKLLSWNRPEFNYNFRYNLNFPFPFSDKWRTPSGVHASPIFRQSGRVIVIFFWRIVNYFEFHFRKSLVPLILTYTSFLLIWLLIMNDVNVKIFWWMFGCQFFVLVTTFATSFQLNEHQILNHQILDVDSASWRWNSADKAR